MLICACVSLSWFPVVFTFSFTNKEMQTEPLTSLRERFENLDIKLLTDYHIGHTTHVVSKKRNTAKGLQALINGKHIVTESFLDDVVQAAGPSSNETVTDASRLEQDFRQYWPDAMQHLPPRGGEPVQHPDSIYAPDADRSDIFDGYTFIFYDRTQYNNLLAPITNGGGKALIETIEPGTTQVDDFVRYVKSVAGEKGLGSFEDGSEGKGVVLVRYLPAKGEFLSWYTEFFTAVSLRLDHRPIEQSEFLEAILIKDASQLRRPLEVESQDSESAVVAVRGSASDQAPAASSQAVQEESQPAVARRGARRPAKRRFAGFADDEYDESGIDPSIPSAQDNNVGPPAEEGLFVSQEEPSQMEGLQDEHGVQGPGTNLLEGMEEGVARYKRQKLDHGITSGPPSSEPEQAEKPAKTTKRAKKTYNVLEEAAKTRREEEARARAEEEDLAQLPDDVDLSEIRRLNIVEEMPLRRESAARKTREQDVADGRWKPEWNGMQNFKKFRRRGEATGRQPARIIVSLTHVKAKEYGVGDDYWLEDETSQVKGKSAPSEEPSARTQVSSDTGQRSSRKAVVVEEESPEEEQQPSEVRGTEKDDSPDEATLPEAADIKPGTQRGSTRSASQRKRPAPAPAPAASRTSKRQRQAPRMEIQDSEQSGDSDDELKFRFGRRR